MDIQYYAQNEYLNSLTFNEKKALYCYTSYESGIINYILRNQRELTKTVRKKIYLIDSSLEKFKYKENLVVYRDLLLTARALKEFLIQMDSLLVFEYGYYSCSMIKGAYTKEYNVRMEIILPSYLSAGAYIKYISNNFNEEGYLLKRNTIYETIDVNKSRGKYHIKRKVIE